MTARPFPHKKRVNSQTKRAKINELYTKQDVMKLFNVCPGTVSNWVRTGLAYIDSEPRLFLGSDLNDYHKQLRQKKRIPTGRFEGYCPGCRTGHSLLTYPIEIRPLPRGNFRVFVICPGGAGQGGKWFAEDELAILQALRETNPGPETRD